MASVQRKTIKYQSLSPAVSCSRLRQVQSILSDSSKSKPDGILCILGIDSRYNEGCIELASYLLFGLYSPSNMDLERTQFPEEVLDDVILLIKSESVHLYCNPVNYSYLLPYVGHWRNLHLHCMTKTEYEDEEAAEEFKISSFVDMVQDCSCIGIPYSSHGHVQKFDIFVVEKWPIIQAFGLEGIGVGGFFTMKHKLIDVSEKLWQTYSMMDPVALEILLTEDLVTFEKQWASFYSNFDIDSHSYIMELSEAQAGELVQCVAPKGPLACARTCFFGTTHVPYLGKTTVLKMYSLTCRILSQIYEATVQAVLAGIKCYSCTFSATKAKDMANQTFQSSLDCCNLTQYKNALRTVPLENDGSRSLVKTSGTGNAICYMIYPDDSVSTDSCFTILTASIPVYVSWLVEDSDVKISEKVQQLLKEEEETCLGSPLSVGETTFIYSSNLLAWPEEGKISFFSEGILFIHPHYGSVTISKNLINALKFYDEDSPSVVAMLLIEYKRPLLPHLPFQLHSTSNCLAFALLPKSKSYKAFYSQVMASWKQQLDDSGVVLKMVRSEQLSEEQTNMHAKLQKLYESHSIPVGERWCQAASAELPQLETFMKHFEVSSVGKEPVKRTHFPALFHHPSLPANIHEESEKVVITIITGLPGSHKDSLCNFLVNLNKEHGRWAIYRQAPDDCDYFSAVNFQRYLSSVLETQRQSAYTCKRLRLLVITPGYTDAIDAVQAVQAHPDPDVQSTFSVGAVTACVDPLSSYMEHRFLFPKFLEQCSQGVVSSVVFTGLTGEHRHPLLLQLQQLIRAANPTAAFILAEKGAVTRSECKFSSGPVCPSMTQITVRFSRSLEKPRFMTCCKDSEKVVEVSHHTLTNSLSLLPVQEGPSRPSQKGASRREPCDCFIVFDGTCLSEEALRDWLRQCANQIICQYQYFLTETSKESPEETRNLDNAGDKEHSLMEQFIDEYVEEANREIEQYNLQLEQQRHVDLFEP
ncbi:hypothetical protein EOD39_5446 [Acipenser ruthenus]|uniref:Uncharacterized protein n=1 Tax=Acipenser ruthenus TaxID=7906 RepID=A0A444UE02_ACIRT|nr:hypothetical protein EOD39_5446 [Acipenser ruthenus]